jgi:hypothetical protein
MLYVVYRKYGIVDHVCITANNCNCQYVVRYQTREVYAQTNTQTCKMSRCIDLPPAASPSLSIESSAIDPNFVAAAPYEPIAGARRTGSGSLQWDPLIGAFNGTQRKIEIWMEHRSWVAAIR